MRLIDAEELGKKIEEEFDGICAYDVSPDEAVNDFQDIVDSCKTIDAAPVVHGRWVEGRQYYNAQENICSVCGQLLTTHIGQKKPYCPECGTKMDEE